MVSDSDKNQFKESFKKFTSIFHKKNRSKCKTAGGPATKDKLPNVEKCEIFKTRLKELFKIEHQQGSIGSNSNSNSFETGSEEIQCRDSGNRFASFFQTENREYFDAGTESTVDSDIPRVKKRIILKKMFKELFQKEKKPYFPAPCSEYDSSAPVTLTTSDMLSESSRLRIRKRDIFKNTLKSIFKIDKGDKETKLDHLEKSGQVKEECSFQLREDCELPKDLQYEEERAQAYAYVYCDDTVTSITNIPSRIALPEEAHETFKEYDEINEHRSRTSSSCYIREVLRGDEFKTSPPLNPEYNNKSYYLNMINSENPYKPLVNYDNYEDSFIYQTKPVSEVKESDVRESKFKNGIKKIISFIKNSFPSFTVLFSTE